MSPLPLFRIAILAGLLFGSNACNRAVTITTAKAPETPRGPTAEDVRIGRGAISISEVSLLARTGFHKDALAAVKQRHVPEHLTAEEMVHFQGFAKPELLAALRDPVNILTPFQKDAYDEAKTKSASLKQQLASTQGALANSKSQQAHAQAEQAWAASVAEQQEIQRRERLHQENLYAAERSKAEQTAKEREQLRSVEDRWKLMEFQNSIRQQPYGTTPVVRRYRPYSY
jgi:hypothetical protein